MFSLRKKYNLFYKVVISLLEFIDSQGDFSAIFEGGGGTS